VSREKAVRSLMRNRRLRKAGIHRDAINMKFIVQVGAFDPTGSVYRGDRISLPEAVSFVHLHPAEI
jgi:hypothetical protein